MARIEAEDGAHPLFELETGPDHRGRLPRQARRRARARDRPPARDAPLRRDLLRGAEPQRADDRADARAQGAAGYRMAMLTNNVKEWEARWRSMLPVDEIFELVVDSAFVGMRKPDAEIYELTLERLGGPAPGECLFIDDIEANIDAAARPRPRTRSTSAAHGQASRTEIRAARCTAALVVGARAVPDVELGRLAGELHQAGAREPLQDRVQGALLADALLEGLLAAEAGGELQGLAAVLAERRRRRPSGSRGWGAAGRPPSSRARRRASRCRARPARRWPWRSGRRAPPRGSRPPRRGRPRPGAGGAPRARRSRRWRGLRLLGLRSKVSCQFLVVLVPVTLGLVSEAQS